jgi:phosphonoacetaldehyde hydrolase
MRNGTDSESMRLKAVVFDWAGTLIDYGSCAPVSAFVDLFAAEGVPITMDEARAPMGTAKRDHIWSLAAMPRVAERWQQAKGTVVTEVDIDRLYDAFLPLQDEAIRRHSELIPGAADAIRLCRNRGLKIGSSTGYNREGADICAGAAVSQGVVIDAVVSNDDVSAGRPAPWLIFENMRRLNVYPPATVMKVDDTTAGIEAGVNAGCWSIGITRTGNGLGLSLDEDMALSAEQRTERLGAAAAAMLNAGAHFVVESVAELGPVIEQINQQLSEGAGVLPTGRATAGP